MSAAGGAPRASVARIWSDAFGRAGTRAAQMLVLAAVLVAVVWLLSRLAIVTIPLVLALIFAAAFAPWMEWTRRRNLPPTLGAALALLILLTVIAGTLVFVVGSVNHEWRALGIAAEQGFQRVVTWLQTLPFSPDQRQLNEVTEQVSGFVSSAEFGSGALGGISAITDIQRGPRDDGDDPLFPPQGRSSDVGVPTSGRSRESCTTARSASSVKTVDVFGGYIRSTTAAALFDAVGILIGLLLLQVPLAIPLAILTFLLAAFIPIVGAVSAGGVAALVALVSNGPLNAALVVLVVIIVNQLEGNVLKPILMAKTVSLPRPRRAHSHRGRHRRRRDHRSPARRPAHRAARGTVQVWDGDNVPCTPGRARSHARRISGFASGLLAPPGIPVTSCCRAPYFHRAGRKE